MGPTNCLLIKCREGYMAIDTSFAEYYQKYLATLKSIHIDPSEIKYLLLTHHHDDHVGFAARLKEKTGCRIIAHENAVDALEKGSMAFEEGSKPLNRRVKITMAIFNKVKRRTFKVPPIIFTNDDIIVTGENSAILAEMGIAGKIIYTPGHTVDSISVILTNGDAFVGDICNKLPEFLWHPLPADLVL